MTATHVSNPNQGKMRKFMSTRRAILVWTCCVLFVVPPPSIFMFVHYGSPHWPNLPAFLKQFSVFLMILLVFGVLVILLLNYANRIYQKWSSRIETYISKPQRRRPLSSVSFHAGEAAGAEDFDFQMIIHDNLLKKRVCAVQSRVIQWLISGKEEVQSWYDDRQLLSSLEALLSSSQ